METLGRSIKIPIPVLVLLLILPLLTIMIEGGSDSTSLSGTLANEGVSVDGSATLTEINKSRSSGLTLNSALTAAAQARANDMANGTSGDTATYVTNAGYVYTSFASAYLRASGVRTPAAIASTFIKQASVLDAKYADAGIAVAKDTAGLYYYVIVLGKSEATTAPGTNISNPGVQTSEGQAAEIIDMLNAARVSMGLCHLVYNAQLVAAASAHSLDQAKGDFLSHTGSNGSTVASRVAATGYPAVYRGENVLSRSNVNSSGAFNQWWNSPEHYNNMMNNNFTEIGVAYAGPSATGKYYYTMVLGSRGGVNNCTVDPMAPVPQNTESGNTTTESAPSNESGTAEAP